jgi:hypothetical protein
MGSGRANESWALVLLPCHCKSLTGKFLFRLLPRIINTIFIKPKLQEVVPILVEAKGDQKGTNSYYPLFGTQF